MVNSVMSAYSVPQVESATHAAAGITNRQSTNKTAAADSIRCSTFAEERTANTLSAPCLSFINTSQSKNLHEPRLESLQEIE